MPNAKQAITYTRVSSKEQLKEGFSIPAQRHLLTRYAREHHLTIAAEFSDDETAKNTGRTDFTRLIAYLKKHERVRTILVEKTDRLYRNLKDYLTLDEFGVEIHFVKEASIISPESHSSARFLHGIKVLMARNYVENLSEEVKKGMHQKASEGGYPTMAPLGYINAKQPCGIIPDPEKAPLIRELFEAASTDSYSLDDLKRLARHTGLRGRNGQPIARSKIAFVLQNTAYTGTFTWGGRTYQGKYEPIVTTALFNEVQDVLAGRSRPRGQDRTFIYTGLLRCQTCNGLLTGDLKKQRYVYYACRGSRGCKRYYPESVFEAETLRILASLTIDEATSTWLVTQLAASFDERNDADTAQLARLQKRLTELRHLTKASYEEKLLGHVDETTWREHNHDWQTEISDLETAMSALAPNIAREEFIQRVRTPLELLQTAATQYVAQSPREKARLLKTLCSNYTVSAASLTLQMRSPFDVLAKVAATGDWLGGRESNPD